MTGPACSICRHPSCADIDEALATGAALIPTANQYGVSKSSLGRHKNACLAPKLAAAARLTAPASSARDPILRARAIANGQASSDPADILSLTHLVAKLATSLSRLDAAADQAAVASAYGALAALSGQLHRGIEAAAKIQRFYDDVPQASSFSIVIKIGSPKSDSDATGAEEVLPRLLTAGANG